MNCVFGSTSEVSFVMLERKDAAGIFLPCYGSTYLTVCWSWWWANLSKIVIYLLFGGLLSLMNFSFRACVLFSIYFDKPLSCVESIYLY